MSYCHFQIFEHCHILESSVSSIYVIVAFWWREINIYLVFSVFTYRPTSLLMSITTSVFLWYLYYLSIYLHHVHSPEDDMAHLI
jgi:hypothetical protein